MTSVNRKTKTRCRSRGVTLVELLVVLAIISFLTAILIPRIRVINKDRGIRESARVVASAFAKVSSRAVDERVAGIVIERNPNFVDAAGVTFGATTMYVLRALPPYGGDEQFDPTLNQANSNGAVVESTSGSSMVVSIPIPLEHTSTSPLIQVNDYIRLNYSSVQYRITNVAIASGKMQLSLSLGNGFAVLPAPNLTQPPDPGLPFLIYRKPRKLESSRIDLPSGYVIDLRYSGPVSTRPPATNTGTVFNQMNPDTIELMYDDHGAVERIYYTEPGPPPARVSVIPLDTIYFFVADVEADPAVLPIYQPGNMWVTLERASGSANVAYNAPPPTGLPLDQQVETARTLAANRLSALQ
jgi:prepilin-type N-terminal cleavage/methylation domain-containing protein